MGKKDSKWKKKGESDSEEEEEEVKTVKKGTYADQEKVDETQKRKNLFLGES